MRIELLYFRRLSPDLFRLAFFDHFSRRTAILELFSTRKIAKLAKSLAQDVAKRCPPAIVNNPIRMVSQQRLSDILEEVFTSAAHFTSENKLGWYKRAKLRRDFRWELVELGYDKKFVDTATASLVVCMTRDPSLKS